MVAIGNGKIGDGKIGNNIEERGRRGGRGYKWVEDKLNLENDKGGWPQVNLTLRPSPLSCCTAVSCNLSHPSTAICSIRQLQSVPAVSCELPRPIYVKKKEMTDGVSHLLFS